MNDRIHPTILQALKPFAPPESDEVPATPRCEKGLVRLWMDVDFLRGSAICDFDYEPGEKGSWQHGQQQEPDSGSRMTLHRFWVLGTDISSHLTKAVIKELEIQALEEHETPEVY